MLSPHITTVSLVESNANPGGVQLVNSKLTNRVGEPTDLVELAKQVQKADEFVRANAGNKLTVIADQMRYLQQKAKECLEEAKLSADLHHYACNLVKKPGTIYNLYERASGQKYFSLLSPAEWGPSCPHEFIASYRLEHDMSWTTMENLEQRSQELAIVDKVLNAQFAITDSATSGIQHGLLRDISKTN